MSGPPPEGHDRQCQARSRVTRQRCRRWALKGRKYCQFHGGRRQPVRTDNLPRYSKHLGKVLQDKLNEYLSEPHSEMLGLYEELAIARVTVEDSLKLFDAAMNKGDTAARMTASDLIRTALNHVRDMCLAAAKIEREAEDKVSLRVVQLFSNQIVRCIHRVCPDRGLAIRLEREIRENVRLPKEVDTTGVDFTVGDQLKDMDLSTEPGDEDNDSGIDKGQE